MKTLKITIIGMSALIIAAVVLIIYKIAGGFHSSSATSSKTEIYHRLVEMPGDCRPTNMTAVGGLISLSITGTSACPQLLIVNPADGQVVGDWQFVNKPK